MHNYDVDEQTRELSYSREVKTLDISDSKRVAELYKANIYDLGPQLSKCLCTNSSVCQVKKFSFEWNRQSLLSPGAKLLCLQITKALGNQYIASEQDYNVEKVFFKIIYTPSGG